jgi:hypothetical protein
MNAPRELSSQERSVIAALLQGKPDTTHFINTLDNLVAMGESRHPGNPGESRHPAGEARARPGTQGIQTTSDSPPTHRIAGRSNSPGHPRSRT